MTVMRLERVNYMMVVRLISCNFHSVQNEQNDSMSSEHLELNSLELNLNGFYNLDNLVTKKIKLECFLYCSRPSLSTVVLDYVLLL